MAMWRGGQLDGDMAMQLLGLQLTTGSSSATSNLEAGAPTGDTGNDSKKRPISQVTPSEPEESLEDVLEQAKKAKNEAWSCWFITLFPSQNKKWKNSQHDNKLTLTTWIRTYCLNRCQHRGPLRRKTPWRQSWGVCASPKKMGSCKFHSGSMTSGRMEITWPWPNSLHSATSTRIANQQSMQFIHCIFCQFTLHVGRATHISNPNKSRASRIQEAFIKFKEKSLTKNDKTVSDLEMGWYSRDDMLKVLKWNTSLIQIRWTTIEHVNAFAKLPWLYNLYSCVLFWGMLRLAWNVCVYHVARKNLMICSNTSSMRKKIDGAIKCCEQDPANLVR